MDFKSLNNRERAEAGARMQILDPDTRQPIDGTFVVVRGVASPTIQTAQRARAQERMRTRKSGAADSADRVMEDAHNEMMDAALPFIAELIGVEYDGRKLTEADAREFLNWSFPDMGVVKDDDGDPVMVETKDAKGSTVMVPKFELKNLPFAKQVADFAGEQSNFLASGGKR